MPGLIIKPPIERQITLNLPTDLDPDQATYVVIRAATVRDVERRSQIGAETSRIFREGEKTVEVKYHWSYPEQQRLEVYMTLAECNIQIDDPDTEKPRPLFRFRRDGSGKMRVDMSEGEFAEAWGLLQESVAKAIHEAVLKVNPQWDPNFR